MMLQGQKSSQTAKVRSVDADTVKREQLDIQPLNAAVQVLCKPGVQLPKGLHGSSSGSTGEYRMLPAVLHQLW